MNGDWRDRLLAYDERGLDSSERAALERLLDIDPEARELLAQLRADRETFRHAFAGVEARSGFTDGVMRRLPAPRRARLPLPRLLEVIAAGMMALVVATLVSPARQVERQRQLVCQSEVKDLTRAVLSYAQDYDDRLPDARRWVAEVSTHNGAPILPRCPSDQRDTTTSYSLPIGLSGAPLHSLGAPHSQVALFDANGPLLDPRHEGGANVGFLDGSVRWFSQDDLRATDWGGGH